MLRTFAFKTAPQLRRSLWLSGFLVLSTSACSKPTPVKAPAPIEEQPAKALITQLTQTLLGELQTAIQAEGPAHAIRVCAERAPAIGRELSQGEYSIRRIGVRVRNPATNTPTQAERSHLEALSKSNQVYQGLIDGKPVYLQALFLGAPLCLTCHGSQDEIPEAVRTTLAELYPEDQATGFALGDLRGAFLVERR